MSARWADPLSRAERRELAGKLMRATRLFGAAATAPGDGRLAMSLVLASGETAVLYTDITERAGGQVMTARQAEAPHPAPGVKCGSRHPSINGARCTRDPRHKGGHRDAALDLYWQAEEATS